MRLFPDSHSDRRRPSRRPRPTHRPRTATIPYSSRLLLARTFVRAKHRNGFNLAQQSGTAQLGLNARRRRQRIEPLRLEESGALFVECFVVTIDVAQITRSTHDLVPRAAFAREQAGDVIERAPHLGAEVADVYALAALVDGRGTRDEENGQPIQVDAHAARKRAWLGVGVGLVQDAVIGHGALLNGRVCDGLQYFCECNHDELLLYRYR